MLKNQRFPVRVRSQKDYDLKVLPYFGPKIWNILPSDIKSLEHFMNSQKKLSHGFLEIVLVEFEKKTYIKDIINTYKCLLKNANFSIKISNE